MSLRERKKKAVRNKIIQTAKKQFLADGYVSVTMTEIARQADVGVGTIYNYFPSKSSLLLAIFTEEMAEMSSDEQPLLPLQDERVTDTIIHFLTETMRLLEAYPKSFWREILIVAMESMSDQPDDLLRGFMKLDMEMMDVLAKTLAGFKEQGKLPQDFQIDQAIQAIYGMLTLQFISFLFNESATMEMMFEQVRQQIEFLFAGKI